MEETIEEIEEEKEILTPDYDTDQKVVLKHEVGQRIDDWWADTVIPAMKYKWFRIKKEGNRIIIEPVEITPIN